MIDSESEPRGEPRRPKGASMSLTALERYARLEAEARYLDVPGRAPRAAILGNPATGSGNGGTPPPGAICVRHAARLTRGGGVG